jgi:hypothetical protein
MFGGDYGCGEHPLFHARGDYGQEHTSFEPPPREWANYDEKSNYMTPAEAQERLDYINFTCKDDPYKKAMMMEPGCYIETPGLPGLQPRYW